MGVEKLPLPRKSSKFGRPEMPRNSRRSLITHPDEILFLRFQGERVFQHPRVFSPTIVRVVCSLQNFKSSKFDDWPASHFLGKFGSFLISRICWMWRSACVEISNIHCQQSITCAPLPKLCARKSSFVVLTYSIIVARSD